MRTLTSAAGRRAGGDLRIQQRPHAAKDDRRHIGVRQQAFLCQAAATLVGLRRADEDVEVLTHERVLFGRAARFKSLQRRFGGGAGALSLCCRQIRHRLVEPADAELTGALRRNAREHVEQHLGVLVARHDPAARIRGLYCR